MRTICEGQPALHMYSCYLPSLQRATPHAVSRSRLHCRRYGLGDGFPGGAADQWGSGPQDEWQLKTDWQQGSVAAGDVAPQAMPSEFNNF